MGITTGLSGSESLLDLEDRIGHLKQAIGNDAGSDDERGGQKDVSAGSHELQLFASSVDVHVVSKWSIPDAPDRRIG